jgi:hypothetical protein
MAPIPVVALVGYTNAGTSSHATMTSSMSVRKCMHINSMPATDPFLRSHRLYSLAASVMVNRQVHPAEQADLGRCPGRGQAVRDLGPNHAKDQVSIQRQDT